jgi:hypothetical protein
VVSLSEPSLNPDINNTITLDHCINYILQMLMCSIDFTPIPILFYKGIDRDFVDSDQVHTCRDWAQLRSWIHERFARSEEIG